ncbi:hypothetical protein KIW84_013425 [Lathyrus oleraceus]|uniref:Uncharacterized protein n=1 Tax=Pisum sativum TaxID=3888 RepID=A0A9D5BK08_PEA|nr:hypothetical protein KIW84_013425 [Pisum sativum]
MPDFVYSTYYASFSYFLTSIYSLSEPSSYNVAILNPLWQQVMAEELSALHKTNTLELEWIKGRKKQSKNHVLFHNANSGSLNETKSEAKHPGSLAASSNEEAAKARFSK